MIVHINGDQRELSSQLQTVFDLVNDYNLSEKNVIVELNGRIIEASKHRDTPIQEGDRVELVQFVGGG
ncbi:sulfur carrier protein ThiS [Alkalibacillus aidingensis]|uniref:sulfur carrier protein ThiS n=1 Tax=Alkalibacillus aidingensis TaxID=2747607 RepID=UPI001660CC24|nr:sulfur carrier protein ThiS [Alkalibacillus aidingensis]